MHKSLVLVAAILGSLPSALPAQNDSLPPGIVWYGVLEDGLTQAKETERPILLISAAPQCAGVPGMW